MKCNFRRDFTMFFFFFRSKMASPQNCSDSAKMCDNLNGCRSVIRQLCVLCAKYLQPGRDDLTCDACPRHFHKNCSIGTFKSAHSTINSESVRCSLCASKIIRCNNVTGDFCFRSNDPFVANEVDYSEFFNYCAYYDLNSLNSLATNQELFIMHFLQIDLLAISETKLIPNHIPVNFNLDGYVFIHTDGPTNAGGVGFYIKETLNYKLRKDVNIDIGYVENMWIEIETTGDFNIKAMVSETM